MRLHDLGPRLCILGPSNSGKSTLAAAIGRVRGVSPLYLDQLHHEPHSDWRPRPTETFVALHDAALTAPQWIIEGNYGRCLPQRLARATGLILLDVATPVSLLRYLRRCWMDTSRHGGLEGAEDRVTWAMLRYIAVSGPAKRQQYRQLYDGLELPRIAFTGRRELNAFYRREGLER